MKLADLEPTFVGNYNSETHAMRQLDSVEGAQGVIFVCPKCGNHAVLCWFRNPHNAPVVPDDALPGPGRWTFNGDSFDVLTLSPSIDLSRGAGECNWHGFITNGVAT